MQNKIKVYDESTMVKSSDTHKSLASMTMNANALILEEGVPRRTGTNQPND